VVRVVVVAVAATPTKLEPRVPLAKEITEEPLGLIPAPQAPKLELVVAVVELEPLEAPPLKESLEAVETGYPAQ
jgi:hypothetical protein